MGTLLGTYYGSLQSVGDFQVGADVQYEETDPSKGYHIQYRAFIYVTKKRTENFTKGMRVSWASTTYECGKTVGRVGQSGWIDGGWVQWPNRYTIPTISCYYVGGSGTTYRSSLENQTVDMPGALTYTVTFNANGGTGAPSNITANQGSSATIPNVWPTRTGYNFTGWSTSQGGSVSYRPGSTVSSGMNLYAVWTAITYTISFNANGGTGAPSAQTKTYGQTITLSSTRPTRENYDFLGWATSSSGSTAYQPGGQYSANANVTLYAVWKQRANGYMKFSDGWKQGMVYVKYADGWALSEPNEKTSSGWKKAGI